MAGEYIEDVIDVHPVLTPTPDVNIAGGLEGIGSGFGPTFGHFDPSSDLNWDEYAASANFTAINDASTTTQTVSPKDLFNDHPSASAPPSAAFTNLTSPSINESPYVADSYETSPLFQDELAGSDNWYPLFPEGGDPLQRTISDQSIAQTSSSSNSPLVLDTSHLQKSNDRSPLTQALHHRHSSVSGVKPRRRKGPLPPISVDPEDRVAVKRARNTLAARESRQRKVDHVQTLERQISDLKGENERLKRILASVGITEPLP